jgi:hypothetical protein
MDRFDICDAFYVFGMLWHDGQNSKAYGYLSRLANMGYKPSLTTERCKLTSPGARAVYRELCRSHGC